MSAYTSTVLATTGLVSYWQCGEASGTFADSKDSNPSTDVGAGVTYGSPSLVYDTSCVTLNGTSGWFSVPNAANLQITGALSLECWFNPTTLGTNGTYSCLIAKYDGTGTAGYEIHVVSDGTNGHVEFLVRGASTSAQFDSAANTVAVGATHHVVGTYNDATNTMTIYIDGAQSIQSTSITQVLATNTSLLSVGARSPDGIAAPNNLFASGRFGHAAIYNVELAAAQVLAHYQAAATSTMFPPHRMPLGV